MEHPPVYIGISSGRTGSMAVLNEQDDDCIFCDYLELINMANKILTINSTKTIKNILIERRKPVREKGQRNTASTFKRGENYGAWNGIAMIIKLLQNIPCELIRPKDWQKGTVIRRLPGIPDVKERSLMTARKMFPHLIQYFSEEHHNRANAILIARYLREKILSGKTIPAC